MTAFRTRHIFWLVLILLLGAASRIIGIDAQSLWIDEGFTWHFTQYSDPLRILTNDVHPPLYFYALDAWIALIGTDVIVMRFVSVLPSMLSIAVMYQLGREIERQAGFDSNGIFPLVAALLLALADAENYLAKELRGYTWHVLFASLSMWGFLRWLHVNHWRWLILWVISTIALVYTFYLGAFVGVVQGVYVLLFVQPEGRGYINRQRLTALSALIVAALALVPWLVYTLPEQSGNLSYAEWIRRDAFGFWLTDFRNRYFGQQWVLMLALFFIGLFLLYDGEKWRIKITPAHILLLLWFGLPLLLTAIANERVPLYQPRRVTQVVPAIALLTALGIIQFPKSIQRFLLLIIVIYGVVTVDFWRYKQDWREMAAATAPYIAPTTPVLFELGGDDYAPRYHYAEALQNSHDTLLRQIPENAQSVPLVGLTTWRNLEPETYTGGLPPYINSLEHLWLFYWSSDTGALDWLDTFGFVRTGEFTVEFNPDVYLYRYDKLPDVAQMTFENGMILQEALLHDDSLLVELIWSSEARIEQDYTVSVFLEDSDGQRIAQIDSQPFFNEHPTSAWMADSIIYDPKLMALDSDLSEADYTVRLLVYATETGDRVLSNMGEIVSLGTIHLQARTQ